ncbi:MAG: hypothetical protein KA004_01205 [Verrucomicrobiales bacterium]|nr:hypothetical protein [Verrucomicrobiales bacterium]
MRPISLLLSFATALIGTAILGGCAGTGRHSADPNKPTYCCLFDPEKGHRIMPESTASRVRLERWVERHTAKLQNGKPRFQLLAVSSDLRILDRVPISDQITQKSRHALTPADCAELRACFSGGQPVAVNLASGTVTAP